MYKRQHYTRLEERNGKVYIVAGDDDKKDQSYFLWRLGQEVLKRCIFPLGAFTKMPVSYTHLDVYKRQTVHFRKGSDGKPDAFVYTGDIHAMWLRDSGAQVWPYVQLANNDPKLKEMLAGVILRQFKCINIDPYANAYNDGALPDGHWMSDLTDMKPELHERKWEIDSLCYPLRLAYHYWQVTGDTSVFGAEWLEAIRNIYTTFCQQQRKEGTGPYKFQRKTERALDTLNNDGLGAPVRPVGLIVSCFRPVSYTHLVFTDKPNWRGFKARSVVGGYYMKMLEGKLIGNKQ